LEDEQNCRQIAKGAVIANIARIRGAPGFIPGDYELMATLQFFSLQSQTHPEKG
jgi:hypothetical protein